MRTCCLPLQETFLDTWTPGSRVRHLLVIIVCVSKAAADCPKPERVENTVLTTETLLMNNFPNGVQARFECATGHVKESGSDNITCIDDKWSELELTCTKKDCGPPRIEPNLSFDISGGTLFGDTIKVICDRGYQLRGQSYKTCYYTGWSGRHRCEIVTCEIPAEVTNGRSSWDSKDEPKYGERIHYSCNEGYTLVGNASVACTETGEYDSRPPECEVTEDINATTMITHLTPATPSQGATTIMVPRSTQATPTQDPTIEDIITTTMETHLSPTTTAQDGVTEIINATTMITHLTPATSSQGATTTMVPRSTQATPTQGKSS
ncbi:hypothetical protein Q5P01_001299 [Channa striata]|uniref:Sushi domain-containing protein n=1 Tax=Channa striata TaxID=64152 RepID=A0AA88T2N8_CHASR|nr:hypothetical protein Q5P01_001299 [Channa striata]